MEGLVSKIYSLKKREFIFKRKASGALVTPITKLVNHVEGSSTNTYRRIQCEKSHLPVNFFEDM